MGSLGHDSLKMILDNSNGEFEAVVGLRLTGWCWSPKAMSISSSKCPVWAKNDDRTRMYSVPYSEHSSYTELCTLVEVLRPEILVPTVNSETPVKRQQIVYKFRHALGFGLKFGQAVDDVTSDGLEVTCSGIESCGEQSRTKRPRWAAGLLGSITDTSRVKSAVFADLSNIGDDALLARRTNQHFANSSATQTVTAAKNSEERHVRTLRPFIDVKLRPTVGCRVIDISESLD